MFAFWFLLHWLILFLIPYSFFYSLYDYFFHLSPTKHTHIRTHTWMHTLSSIYFHLFILLEQKLARAHFSFSHFMQFSCSFFHSTHTNHTDTNSKFYRFVFNFMVFAYFSSVLFLFCSMYFSVFFFVSLSFGVMDFFVALFIFV